MSRFTVGSVTGWKIKQEGRASGQRRVPTIIWYVHDSGNCFHVMGEFLNASNGKPGGRIDAETEARKLAKKLNRKYP